MSDDDAPLVAGVVQDVCIRPTNQAFVPRGTQVTAASAKADSDGGSDVLVGKQRKIERLHAVMHSSQVCSPFRASAAYRKAAARLSGVS